MNDLNACSLRSERVALQCVCCGEAHLQKSPAVLMPFVSHRALGLAPVLIDAAWGLNTIAHGMAYCLCNTLHCAHCEFLFLDIRFSDREMAQLYDGYYGEAYEELREHYEPGFRERNQTLKAPTRLMHVTTSYILDYIQPTRVLDWGGGDGTNTPFKGVAAQVDIFDIDQKVTVAGTRSVSRGQLNGSSYDLIVCRHVLEHVPYPADTLDSIKQCMGDDTLLYVELPHEALMVDNQHLAAQQKRHWHEHINFFSAPALENLFASSGLTVMDITSRAIADDSHLGSSSRIFQAMVKKTPMSLTR